MRQYGKATHWPAREQPPSEVETVAPARAASFQGDVLVPASQALLTGLLLGAVLTAGIFLLWGDKVDSQPLAVGGCLALAISTLTWLVLLTDTRRLLWAVERLTHLDIDQDGHRGPPEERLVVVNAGASQKPTGQEVENKRKSQFQIFVMGLSAKGTGLRAWEKEIGRERYAEYRDALIRLGWAEWKSLKDDGTPNERQGWELVWDADDILARIS